MQRWQAAFFGALLVLAAYVIIRESSGRRAADVALATSATAAAPPAAPISPAARPFSLDLDAGIELPLDEPLLATTHGDALPNGSSAPRLADGAPKTVAFGAVLVEYKGVQAASRNARSRDEALELAKQLAERAKTDFAGAVKAGDKGSGEDFGAIPRGILEPGPEFVLFNLRVGEVSDPVDSPRGFYVFKRTD